MQQVRIDKLRVNHSTGIYHKLSLYPFLVRRVICDVLLGKEYATN